MRAVALVGMVGCSFVPGSLVGVSADAGDETADASSIDGTVSTRDADLDAPVSTSTARRMRLTFQNGARASALDGFPVLVALDSTKVTYSAIAANGADLRFRDGDGTLLPYEIERWDPSGVSPVWVRVPRIEAASNTDFIWLHYGDPAESTDAQDPPAVWTDAVGVWHLAEDPGPGGADEIRDSSSAARHGTASALLTSTERVPAMIGHGLDLPGNRTGVTAASVALAQYTYSLWVRGDTAPATGSGNKQPLSNGDANFNFSWDHNLGPYTAAVAHRDAVEWKSIAFGTLQAATWYHVTGTYDGASLCMYVDGASPACVTAGTPLMPSSSSLLIGHATSSATVSFAGIIDEVRVLSVARSADWINAEFASQRASSGAPFVTFGTPETF